MNERINHNRTIALRFLKETKLLPYWKEYLDSSMHKNRDNYDSKIHWADKKYIVDIFGQSKFTDFLQQKGIRFKHGACSFQIFANFLRAFYPDEYVDSRDCYGGANAIILDKEKKTAKLILSNSEVWK